MKRSNWMVVALAAVAVLFVAPAAFAEGGEHAVGAGGLGALAAGLGLGIAVLGGALGQGRTAATALEGIARNPGASGNMFLPFILGMVLIESLVIYSLVVSLQLAGKV